jgi:poly(3-hydroxybutyrate) depolymerase
MSESELNCLRVPYSGIHRSAFFLSPANPRALLVLLHPIGSSGASMAEAGHWLQQDYAVLAPEALQLRIAKPRCSRRNPSAWSSLQAVVERLPDGGDVDDLGFIDAAIDVADGVLERKLPLLLVGHSNGCAMAFRVLAEGKHKKRFVAASLMAASWAGPKQELHCAMLFSSGTHDPIRPWQGHPGIRMPWLTFPQDTVETTVSQCEAALDASPTDWHEMAASEDVTLRENRSGRRRLQFLKMHDQGHGWPVGQPVSSAYLGPNNEAINLTARSLAFFAEELAFQATSPSDAEATLEAA